MSIFASSDRVHARASRIARPSSSSSFQPLIRSSSRSCARPAAMRQRIARQRPGLINRTVRRKLVHDFGASAKCADRQSAADYFSKRSQIRFDSVNFLRAAARDAKSGHHFVENQKRAVPRAFLAQDREKVFLGKIKTRRSRESARESPRRFRFCFPETLSATSSTSLNGNEIVRSANACRHAGAVGLAVGERAAARSSPAAHRHARDNNHRT